MSSKRSRSKGNSLPPRSSLISPWWMTTSRSCNAVSPLKKRMQTWRNVRNSTKTGPTQGTITAAQPLKWCRMIFSSLTPHCNSSKSASTMVLSNHWAGGRLLPLLWEHLEDLAILCRLKARYQLQVCNPQPEHSTIQTTRAFSGLLFLVNHLLHAFSGVLRTLLHETPLKAYSNYLLVNASSCLQSSHTRILLYWIQTDVYNVYCVRVHARTD